MGAGNWGPLQEQCSELTQLIHSSGGAKLWGIGCPCWCLWWGQVGAGVGTAYVPISRATSWPCPDLSGCVRIWGSQGPSSPWPGRDPGLFTLLASYARSFLLAPLRLVDPLWVLFSALALCKAGKALPPAALPVLPMPVTPERKGPELSGGPRWTVCRVSGWGGYRGRGQMWRDWEVSGIGLHGVKFPKAQ